MRAQKDSKKAKGSERRLGWEDWQRYVQKETQRLAKRAEAHVIELSIPEPEPFHLDTVEVRPPQFERPPVDLPQGRRPPLAGVPREEALEVNDDEIGRTVRPLRVDDYRDIRPLTSPDIFATPSDTSSQPAITPQPSVQPPVSTTEPAESFLEPVASQEVVASPPQTSTIPETSSSPPPAAHETKKRGRKKHQEEPLRLFGEEVPEHQAITRRRLTKKTRLEREELIEKLLDPVISLEEAATLIGVCKTTVRRYTNRGELACIRTPGQQRRFKLSQVLEFVKKREEEEKARRKGLGKDK